MRQSSGVRMKTSKLEAVRRLSGEMAMTGNREEREQKKVVERARQREDSESRLAHSA